MKRETHTQTAFIGFKCSEELRRCLAHIARREGRSLAGQIRWFLEQSTGPEESPPDEVPELPELIGDPPSVLDAELIVEPPTEEPA